MQNNLKKNKHVKNSKLNLVLFCVVVFSLIVIIFSVGKYNPLPFPLSTTCSGVSDNHYDENLSVVIDDSGMRVLFLDEEEKLVEAKTTGLLDSPLKFYTACASDSEYYYVSAYSIDPETSLYCNQSVDKYDKNGKLIATLYSQNYDKDTQAEFNCIQNITIDKDSLYLTSISYDYLKCDVLIVDKNTSVDNNHEQTSTDSNSIYKYKNIVLDKDGKVIKYAMYKPQTDQLALLSSTGYCYVLSNELFSLNKEKISTEITWDTYISDIDSNGPQILTSKIAENKEFSYSTNLTIRLILFWISVFALTVLVLVLIFSLAIKMIKSKKKLNFRFLLLLISAVVISVIVVAYYTSVINQKSEENNVSSLTTINNLMSTSYKDEIVDCLTQYNETNTVETDKYNNLHNILYTSKLATIEIGNETHFAIITYSNDAWKLVIGSSSDFVSSKIDNYSIAYFINDDTALAKHKNAGGYYLDVGRYIKNDNNENIGALLVITQHSVFDSGTLHNCIWIFITLLATIITISFIAMELNSFNKHHSLRKKLRQNKAKHAEAVLARPLHFFSLLCNSFDVALITLIALDMLGDASSDYAMLLIGLPLCFKSIGFVVAIPIQARLISKFNTKKVIAWASVLSTFCYFACFVTVKFNLFWILLLFLLLSSALTEVVYLLAVSLPMTISDKKLRRKINRELGASQISSFSIATLISGFVVGQLGNEYIYIFATLACVLLSIYIVIAIPKNIDLHDMLGNKQNKTGTVKQMKVIFSHPSMFVIIVFGILMTMLAHGYQSFLFPIIADSNNISKTVISNIIVFVNALIFYTVPIVTKLENKTTHVKMIIICCVSIGVMYFTYLINNSMVWSVVMLFMISIILKVVIPAIPNYWQEYVNTHNLDKVSAQKLASYFTYFGNTVRNPILGVLLNVGFSFCMAMIGLFSLLTALLVRVFCDRKDQQ